jgi:phage-related protein
MPDVGLGVKEIRLHQEGEYLVMYVARFGEAVYVLHAFAKKSRRTPRPEADLARERFRALVAHRKQG